MNEVSANLCNAGELDSLHISPGTAATSAKIEQDIFRVASETDAVRAATEKLKKNSQKKFSKFSSNFIADGIEGPGEPTTTSNVANNRILGQAVTIIDAADSYQRTISLPQPSSSSRQYEVGATLPAINYHQNVAVLSDNLNAKEFTLPNTSAARVTNIPKVRAIRASVINNLPSANVEAPVLNSTAASTETVAYNSHMPELPNMISAETIKPLKELKPDKWEDQIASSITAGVWGNDQRFTNSVDLQDASPNKPVTLPGLVYNSTHLTPFAQPSKHRYGSQSISSVESNISRDGTHILSLSDTKTWVNPLSVGPSPCDNGNDNDGDIDFRGIDEYIVEARLLDVTMQLKEQEAKSEFFRSDTIALQSQVDALNQKLILTRKDLERSESLVTSYEAEMAKIVSERNFLKSNLSEKTKKLLLCENELKNAKFREHEHLANLQECEAKLDLLKEQSFGEQYDLSSRIHNMKLAANEKVELHNRLSEKDKRISELESMMSALSKERALQDSLIGRNSNDIIAIDKIVSMSSKMHIQRLYFLLWKQKCSWQRQNELATPLSDVKTNGNFVPKESNSTSTISNTTNRSNFKYLIIIAILQAFVIMLISLCGYLFFAYYGTCAKRHFRFAY